MVSFFRAIFLACRAIVGWLRLLAGWLAGWLAALAGKPLEVGVVCLQIQKSFLRSLNKISSKKF